MSFSAKKKNRESIGYIHQMPQQYCLSSAFNDVDFKQLRHSIFLFMNSIV